MKKIIIAVIILILILIISCIVFGIYHNNFNTITISNANKISQYPEGTTFAIQIPSSEEENQVTLQQELKNENLPEADTSISSEDEEMAEYLNEESKKDKEKYEKVKEILISYYGEDYINNMYDKAEETFNKISKEGNLLVENKDTEAIYELILDVLKNQKLNYTDKNILLEYLENYTNGINVVSEKLLNEINDTIDEVK